MKKNIRILIAVGLLATFSCKKFVDIDTPNFQITSKDVFSNDETAIAVVNGIYNELMRAYFSNGWQNSVTVLSGISADIIQPVRATHTTFGSFWQNEISTIETPDAEANLSLWNSAYNIVYLANSVLGGLEGSQGVSEVTKNQLMGQALFIRAFCYFYLTNLYSDVPLVLTTDYRKNALASRNPSEDVWNQIATDLDEAVSLLEGLTYYQDGERTHVNQYVAMALRARVYLYQKNWAKAEEFSSRVIVQSDMYDILDDLERVFLANSKEAIWQISPAGNQTRRVSETSLFIPYEFIGHIFSPSIEFSDAFIAAMETDDKRFIHWIGQQFNEEGELVRYYSEKYRYFSIPIGEAIREYSMVLRLAEQYLIRAEARAQLGKRTEAIKDLDKLRQRAGIDLLLDINPGITKEDLLEVIMEERKKELFAEWGHRWLDLKRTGKAAEVLSPLKPLWQDTDVWYPIPEEERLKNPNLGQNLGY